MSSDRFSITSLFIAFIFNIIPITGHAEEKVELFVGFQTTNYSGKACYSDRKNAKKQITKVFQETIGVEVFPGGNCTRYSVLSDNYLFSVYLVFKGPRNQVSKLKERLQGLSFEGEHISFDYLISDSISWTYNYRLYASDEVYRYHWSVVLFSKSFDKEWDESDYFRKNYNPDHKLTRADIMSFLQSEDPGSEKLLEKFEEQYGHLGRIGIIADRYVDLPQSDSKFLLGGPARLYSIEKE